MKYYYLVLALLSVSYGFTISYSSDKNLTVNNQDLTYRESQSELVNFGGFEAFFFSSVSVSSNNASKTSDGLYGAAYATFGLPPTAYLAFYHSSATWNTAANGAMTADVSQSDGFIGKSFLTLEEVNANGTTVNRVNLGTLQWSAGASSAGKGGLNYFSVTSYQRQTGQNITVTFVISDVTGILNITGEPIVTPKSLESIIQISNYTYKSLSNSLKLTIGVGSGEANLQITGTFTSGSGANQTYFSLQGVAEIDGQTKSVNISGFVKGNANSLNNNIGAQVTAKYGRAANFQLVSVTFPAGASSITYDPVIGSGTMPQDTVTTNSNGGLSGTSAGSQAQDNAATFAVLPTVLLLALIKMIL